MQISDDPLELALPGRRHGPARSLATGSSGHVRSAGEGGGLYVICTLFVRTGSNSSMQ